MGMLRSSFVLEPISHKNLILFLKKAIYFSQSSKCATGTKVDLKLHFWIQKHLLPNFKTKVELLPILSSYSRLISRIFIANVLHVIAEAKNFKLKRLTSIICLPKYYPNIIYSQSFVIWQTVTLQTHHMYST